MFLKDYEGALLFPRCREPEVSKGGSTSPCEAAGPLGSRGRRRLMRASQRARSPPECGWKLVSALRSL